MATVDYSPIANSVRSFGTGMANLALKKAQLDQTAQQAALKSALLDAQTEFANSKTALNQQKYDAVAPVIAALKGMDINDINVRNELISAANGKPTYAYSNIGNTGATYNKATGDVAWDGNPLFNSTLAQRESIVGKNNAQAAAAMALKDLRDVQTAAGGWKPGTGGNSANKLGDILKLFTEDHIVDDGLGGKKILQRLNVERLGQAYQTIVSQGGNPYDLAAYMQVLFPQGNTAAPTQTPASTALTQPGAAPTQPVATAPAVGQQMTAQDILDKYARGEITRQQAEQMAAMMGFE